MSLAHDRFAGHFDEGTLPDGCIGPTDLAGWRRVLDALREGGMRIEKDPGPDADLEPLFGPTSEQPTIEVFVGRRPVQVNVFLLDATSIDFDFAMAEMTDQEAVDSLAEFIRVAARAAQAPCEVTPEGYGTPVVARYDPALDEFSVAALPPTLEPMDHPDAWSFYEALGDGDRAELTPREAAVAAICDLRQEVNAGGFESYFRYWGGDTAPLALAGLDETLGPQWSALLRDAMALLGTPYPSTVDEREAVLDDERIESAWPALDERFLDLEEATDADAALAAYLRNS